MEIEVKENGKIFYLIETADDLKEFVYMVNGEQGLPHMPYTNAILMADIDLNPGLDPKNEADRPMCESWIPAGNMRIESVAAKEDNIEYLGTFDGNGYTISGLYMDNRSRALYGDGFGFFGHVGDDAVIKNLTIDGWIKEDRMYIGSVGLGSIAGWSSGKILEVLNKVEIIGNNTAGGIVGCNEGEITNCTNSLGTMIKGTVNIGGIAGRNYSTVANCLNQAEVCGDHVIGGIVGNNEGDITNCHNIADVSGAVTIGTVAGINQGTVTACVSKNAEGQESEPFGESVEFGMGR